MCISAPRQAGQPGRAAIRALRVCVVDPKADDYQGWEAMAEAKGAKLQIFAGAEEALRVAQSQPIDLWVVNTDLPGLSGCELCSMLKARCSRTAVYLLANEYSPEAEQAAWQAKATLFGCKGSHSTWLHEWLQTCLPHCAASLPTANGRSS